MEVGNDELELIRFLKRRYIKEALFYLIIGFILLFVSLYLYIDGLLSGKSSIAIIIIGAIFILCMIFIIVLGILDLVMYFKLNKDLSELNYINIKGNPKNIKLIRSPKKRSFPAPVIEDIIFIFENGVKIKYHIMYAYDKHTFEYDRIKSDLIEYNCDYYYLKHSHFVTKYDPELGKCINKSLKRINLIFKNKK